MRFERRPQHVIFHDDKPGAHATMFSPSGGKFPFDGEASSFRDDLKEYCWAFVVSETLKEGDRIIFATADREIGGIVRADNVIDATGVNGEVVREGDKPQHLADYNPRPRPIPMYRGDIAVPIQQPLPEPEKPLSWLDRYEQSGPWSHETGTQVKCRRGFVIAKSVDDAQYIAHACEEYPKLMREVEDLEKECSKLKQRLRDYE
jgi:hypothetical protein